MQEFKYQNGLNINNELGGSLTCTTEENIKYFTDYYFGNKILKVIISDDAQVYIGEYYEIKINRLIINGL